MVTKVVDPEDLVKANYDRNGGYDILVDMNQVGLSEDETPPAEIRIEGERFHLSGCVEDHFDKNKPTYWSYWNDNWPAKNLQLHTTTSQRTA